MSIELTKIAVKNYKSNKYEVHMMFGMQIACTCTDQCPSNHLELHSCDLNCRFKKNSWLILPYWSEDVGLFQNTGYPILINQNEIYFLEQKQKSRLTNIFVLGGTQTINVSMEAHWRYIFFKYKQLFIYLRFQETHLKSS